MEDTNVVPLTDRRHSRRHPQITSEWTHTDWTKNERMRLADILFSGLPSLESIDPNSDAA